MSFKIGPSQKTRLTAVTFRLHPKSIGRIRKLAFDHKLTMQELVQQMIEHCLNELESENK